MIILETERLIIRDYDENDLDEVHKLFTDEDVMYYMPDIKTNSIFESKKTLFQSIMESKIPNRKKYFFAIIMKDTGQYIGEIGFSVLFQCEEGKVVNLGYFIFMDFWGQGIVTEAAKAVINYAFNEIDVIKIESGCHKENAGSEMVMIKLGMIKEADFLKHILFNGKLHTRVDYRLLKEEWELKDWKI